MDVEPNTTLESVFPGRANEYKSNAVFVCINRNRSGCVSGRELSGLGIGDPVQARPPGRLQEYGRPPPLSEHLLRRLVGVEASNGQDCQWDIQAGATLPSLHSPSM